MPRNSKEKPEVFYFSKYWSPFLGTLSSELERRFGDPQKAVFSLRGLIPLHMTSALLHDAAKTLSGYEDWHGRDSRFLESEV